MRILLVDVPEQLRRPLQTELGQRHQLLTLTDDDGTSAAFPQCEVVIQGYPPEEHQVERATLGTWSVLRHTGARRYVQLSSMRIFDGYDCGWHVDESWVPQPSSRPAELAVHLAELTSRELSRVSGPEVCVLRLDEVVSAERFDVGPVEPAWLHLDDAVAAVRRAVETEELPQASARWRALHIVRGGGRFPLGRAAKPPFVFRPAHPCPDDTRYARPAHPAAPRPLRDLPRPERITVLGAAGPLGAATSEDLAAEHMLRVTDARLPSELATRAEQSPGAPRLGPLPPPHEELATDVTVADDVVAAAADSDCLINCSVVRTDAASAFRVNVLGALHTMQAAVTAGIPRVVHTGPALVLPPHPIGYLEDRDVLESAPARAGTDLYFLTKLLGQEICRIYAEEHGIACPTLLFCGFVALDQPRRFPPHPFSVSWPDAGRAMAAAATVRRLPSPAPVVHVLAQSPHGRYRADAAWEILGWVAEDSLDSLWHRQD